MFTTPAPSPAVSVTSPQSTTSTPSRSRLRGLSYLRSYTQNHLSSHNTQNSSRQSPRKNLSRSVSYPSTGSPSDDSSSQEPPRPHEQESNQVNPGSPTVVDPGQGSSALARNQQAVPRGRSTLQATIRPQSTIGVPGSTSAPRPFESSTARSSSMTRQQHPAAGRSPADPLPEPQYSGEAQNFARLGGSSEPTTPQAPHVQSESSETAAMANAQAESSDNNESTSKLPTIRFFPHQEHRSGGRPSLNFTPITRTLPNENCVIRVGRYSERTGVPVSNPNTPSDADVGFKSKVVSRRHCEFSYINGSWYIKDVRSSSGTFLNHIRLSQPNQESTLWKVKDGDIVQLGIDFRGGEEMIFRCVKIRVECHRSWQRRVNAFNASAHAQIRELAKSQKPDTDSNDCTICLGRIQPCQSLFVAQCAHVWHYKCIRPIIMDEWPIFNCPNCRAITNLEEEDEVESIAQPTGEPESTAEELPRITNGVHGEDNVETDGDVDPVTGDLDMGDSDLAAIAESSLSIDDEHEEDSQHETNSLLRPSSNGLLSRRQASNSSSPHIDVDAVHDIDIPAWGDSEGQTSSSRPIPSASGYRQITTPTLDALTQEGPLTPRNNAGPFVFDGSGGRGAEQRSAVQNEDNAPS